MVINSEGFKKLIKKHSKWCRLTPNAPCSLTSQFVPHLETQRPFHRRVNFDRIMRELAALHNAKIDSGTFSAPPPDAHTSLASLPETTLESSTLHSSVTYWIHADYQIETELFLLKHLTLQLESSASDSIQRLTRAVYLDDDDWSVCNSLIPETAGQAVRVSYPQILWEENTMRKEVLIAIPG